MNSADRERVKELLARAARVAPPDRVEFIRKATGEDVQIAAEAIDLLATLDDPQFMSSPTRAGIVAALPDSTLTSEKPGALIGRYKLLQLIGEGGFGSVFLAEQTEPVQRRVALKIIKAGMDTKQVIARFEAERQAVALMDHPSIARVLDAGATAAGRPYFVMELVRGEPITRYCDRQRLPVRQRLTLFQDVCNAVQHAHQKGVIHRDLKPSNVLVTVADGEPLPKVIDFGIAKATSSRLTDKTLFTELHQLIGTPEYMSPEQADVSGLDVDTRSDVYSLGVLLYELLSGTTPIERGLLRSNPLAEIHRLIREEEPARPSLRLAHLASSAAEPLPGTSRADRNPADSSVIEIARGRGSDPSTLVKSLRGDLDWIVMKCLEKDRRRRYPTASALAEDVGRFLLDQPVQATPPGRIYTLRKFVRRNHRTVWAGAAITVTLLVAAGISLLFGLSEARHREAAESAQSRAEVAEAETRKRSDELEQVARFQQEQLSHMDVQKMGTDLRAGLLERTREAAVRMNMPPDAAIARIDELEKLMSGTDFTGIALQALNSSFFDHSMSVIEIKFAEQPLVKAELLQALAVALRELGSYDAAGKPQEEALEIRRRLLGDEHTDTLASISEWGVLLESQGHLADAEQFCRRAMEARTRLLGPEHPDTLTSMSNLSLLLKKQGRLTEAEQYGRKALETRRRLLGDEHPDTLTSIDRMGSVLSDQGNLTEAGVYYREALETRRRVFGDSDPRTLTSHNNMGLLLQAQGKLTESEEHLRKTLEVRRQILGDEHPNTLTSIHNMAVLLQLQGRFADAERYCHEALTAGRRILGNEHPNTLSSINRMGVLLQAQGRPEESEVYLREALELHRRILGAEHSRTLSSIGNLGALLFTQGKLAEAEPLFREAMETNNRILGAEHPNTLTSINNMAFILRAKGNHVEAEIYFREGLEVSSHVLGNEHPDTLNSMNNLGGFLHYQGRSSEAEPYLHTALERRRRLLGEEHPDTLTSIALTGSVLNAQGKPEEALALLAPAELANRRVFTGGNLPRVGRFLMALGSARIATGDFNQAQADLNEAYVILDEAQNTTDRDRSELLTSLVRLYEAWHTAEPNMGHDQQADEWRQTAGKAGSGS